jgi:WD40 repeat protein
MLGLMQFGVISGVAMSQCKSPIGFLLLGVLLLAPRRSEGQEPNVEALWADLAATDAAKAYRAVWKLALTPDKAVPFLKTRLQPASGNRKEIDKLVRDLGSETFAVRDKAIAEVERLADAAEESLKQALLDNPGLESRRRIEMLLSRLPDPAGSPTLVRQERALEALELAGTPEALEVVKRLAEGNPAARWTHKAKAVHARLVSRPRLDDTPAKMVDEFGDDLPPGVLARLGTIRMQSGYWAAITPDGKSLITVSDKALHMWDLATGRALPGFPQAKDWPDCRAVAVSPDGKLAGVAYDRAYSFDICELPSGKVLHHQPGKGEIREPSRYAVVFSPDSKTFVITNQLGTQLWDMATGKRLRDFSHASNLYKAVISADSRRLATISHTAPPRIWDVAGGRLLHDLGNQKIPVYSAAINADGTKLVTYAPGPCARIWDCETGKLIRAIPLASEPMHGDPSPSFVFAPEGSTLAVVDCVRKGDPEQRIQMWNMADFDPKPRMLTPPPGIGRLEAFTPDGKTLLWESGSSYRLLDAVTGKDRHGWASRGAVLGVAWSPDGKRIATAGQDGTVGLWDAGNAKRLHTVVGHHGGIGTVVFSPDGKLLVSCGANKEPAVLWDVASGEKKAELDNNRTRLAGVNWAGFSHDSKLLYTAGFGGHGIFETETGKLQGVFATGRISTWNMAFSSEGRFTAVGIDGVAVFDLSGKKFRDGFKIKQCVAHAFSHDSRTLAASGTYGDVVVWELLTGHERARFSFPPKSYSPSGRLAFSPDGRLLAAVGHWRPAPPLQVWDLATGKLLGPFPGHLDSVTAVAFSPDSQRMATASSDGTVLIRRINRK